MNIEPQITCQEASARMACLAMDYDLHADGEEGMAMRQEAFDKDADGVSHGRIELSAKPRARDQGK